MRQQIKPKITKLFTRATITGVIVVALSFILPIVPCTKKATLAEALYKPGLCKLPNPFTEQIVGISTRYYGINPNPLAGLIFQFIVAFIIFTLIFMGIRRKAGKVLDLTKK
tara:strand:+ start:209 stop:541 length:333 start_codon:yes stop_codon:yes gene_type:complete